MRLFTALDLPEDILANLEHLLDHLKPTARIKWSATGNMHITTKFIGEWPDERLGELEAALRGIPPCPPAGAAHPQRRLLSQSALAARILGRDRGAAGTGRARA